MSKTILNAALATLVGVVLVSAGGAATVDVDGAVPTFSAQYRIDYKGRKAGSMLEELRYDAASGIYEFRSSTQLDGLYRLAAGGDAVASSRFEIEGGRIVPLTYSAEGGKSGGSHAEFDWKAASATDGSATDIEVSIGTLDPGSMRIAMMAALIAAAPPATVSVFDGHAVTMYHLSLVGRENLDSPFGQLQAERIVEQRDGSSRETHLWMAPDLCYLPLRIAQKVGGDFELEMKLESVAGIAPGAQGCMS